jgi:hypothetical protein
MQKLVLMTLIGAFAAISTTAHAGFFSRNKAPVVAPTPSSSQASTLKISKKVYLNVPKNLFKNTSEKVSSLWAIDAVLSKKENDNAFRIGIPKVKCMLIRSEPPTYHGPGDENIKLEMTQLIPSKTIQFSGQSAKFNYFIDCNEYLREALPEWWTDVPPFVPPKDTLRFSEAQILAALKSNFPKNMIEIK